MRICCTVLRGAAPGGSFASLRAAALLCICICICICLCHSLSCSCDCEVRAVFSVCDCAPHRTTRTRSPAPPSHSPSRAAAAGARHSQIIPLRTTERKNERREEKRRKEAEARRCVAYGANGTGGEARGLFRALSHEPNRETSVLSALANTRRVATLVIIAQRTTRA